MSLALHWFRSDLRVHDNAALLAAARCGSVVGLYLATPQQWREHHDAPIKQDYWRRNLHLLEQDLKALGIPLLFAEVPDYKAVPLLLEQILPALKVSSLHCNREYPVNERQRDEQVAQLCLQLGIKMQIHDDQTLRPPEVVLNLSGLPYKVFTPFSRTVRVQLAVSEVKPGAAPTIQATPELPRLKQCCMLPELSWPAIDSAWESLWPAGEKLAHKRLQDFVELKIERYHEQRDLPAVAGTSGLSPFLAAGVLSVRQCWVASMQVEQNVGSNTWQNEFLWRDFYKHVIFHFPHVCKHEQWRDDMYHVPWRHDEEDFARWCAGTTGIPIIDAAMRQLLQTGWMHNRLRMITAMFLSKQLLIDWRWGERWFMQHLVDGDFSANNGGWQWSASTGTDAAPYFRIFNPVTQSQRFDPQGTFIRHWVPELAQLDNKKIHIPGSSAQYPPALVDLSFGRQRALNAFKQ